jgi:hypothetical protein
MKLGMFQIFSKTCPHESAEKLDVHREIRYNFSERKSEVGRIPHASEGRKKE